jgi:hypothetical protein
MVLASLPRGWFSGGNGNELTTQARRGELRNGCIGREMDCPLVQIGLLKI